MGEPEPDLGQRLLGSPLAADLCALAAAVAEAGPSGSRAEWARLLKLAASSLRSNGGPGRRRRRRSGSWPPCCRDLALRMQPHGRALGQALLADSGNSTSSTMRSTGSRDGSGCNGPLCAALSSAVASAAADSALPGMPQAGGRDLPVLQLSGRGAGSAGQPPSPAGAAAGYLPSPGAAAGHLPSPGHAPASFAVGHPPSPAGGGVAAASFASGVSSEWTDVPAPRAGGLHIALQPGMLQLATQPLRSPPTARSALSGSPAPNQSSTDSPASPTGGLYQTAGGAARPCFGPPGGALPPARRCGGGNPPPLQAFALPPAPERTRFASPANALATPAQPLVDEGLGDSISIPYTHSVVVGDSFSCASGMGTPPWRAPTLRPAGHYNPAAAMELSGHAARPSAGLEHSMGTVPGQRADPAAGSPRGRTSQPSSGAASPTDDNPCARTLPQGNSPTGSAD
eukprot:TRINITY_DN18144_c0_g1_i1.p1 TRINITY_DN18144_c0_g1~~TRINITY_DN18144_c0_g1_i1.p1  ORF type:complete len:484 (+),score=49.67 TRINITY_DN18144_c0_g1_i1:85-1452(+)